MSFQITYFSLNQRMSISIFVLNLLLCMLFEIIFSVLYSPSASKTCANIMVNQTNGKLIKSNHHKIKRKTQQLVVTEYLTINSNIYLLA